MMAQLIKNRTVVADAWTTLVVAPDEAPDSVALPAGPTIYPLAVWQARKEEILARGTAPGLLLEPADAVEDVAADLGHFAVIAVAFPKFVDGRGYSTASLLRQRYGYAGELRAVGEVLHDQLFYMQRVGFDAFALKDGKDAAYAIANAFATFDETYQVSTSQPQPYFRRRA